MALKKIHREKIFLVLIELFDFVVKVEIEKKIINLNYIKKVIRENEFGRKIN